MQAGQSKGVNRPLFWFHRLWEAVANTRGHLQQSFSDVPHSRPQRLLRPTTVLLYIIVYMDLTQLFWQGPILAFKTAKKSGSRLLHTWYICVTTSVYHGSD